MERGCSQMISFQSCVFLHCKHSQLHVSKSFASLVVISSLHLLLDLEQSGRRDPRSSITPIASHITTPSFVAQFDKALRLPLHRHVLQGAPLPWLNYSRT
jgi:hypothetical protein